MEKPTAKYPLPLFLNGRCAPSAYRRWLERKARAHLKRDRERGNTSATLQEYKAAIHRAVLNNGERDAYTGHLLRWDLISQYNNEESKRFRRKYKQQFGDLPTVDHVGDGLGPADFRICAWRVNDAKNDLSLDEFLKLCRDVLSFSLRRCSGTSEGTQRTPESPEDSVDRPLRSLRRLLGIARTDGPAPTDEECERIFKEELMRKYSGQSRDSGISTVAGGSAKLSGQIAFNEQQATRRARP